jgi:hypothetical protein
MVETILKAQTDMAERRGERFTKAESLKTINRE